MTETIHVLLVDEDVEVLELTETFLEREDEGLDVSTETSAPDALERLRDESFDCVVSDYSMPNMSGVEFLRSVRERAPDLPFFFFTGRDESDIEAESDDVEITGYVQKGTGTDRYGELATEIRSAVED